MSESIRVGLSRSFTSLWAWLPPNSESSLQGLIQSEHRKRESVPQLHLHPLRDCVLDLRISRFFSPTLDFLPWQLSFRRVGAPLESQELPRRNELPIFVNAVGNTTVLGAHTLKVPPPDRFRAKASEVIASLREDKLFPYFFDGGQEESFSKLYDTQTVLYNQGFPIEASMYVARSWLEECMKNHDECHRDLRFKCPRRLVDLGSLYDEEQHTIEEVDCPREINIVEISRLHKPQYLAVSYRWPDNPDMNQQLHQATESRFLDGFPTADLPRVFCDAFTAARMLGFRNIWIDALCIMQGKGGDWHTEASKMASVYGNAILTLCFGDGTDQKLRMPSTHHQVPTKPCRSERQNCTLEEASRAALRPFITGKISEIDKRSPESIYRWLESTGNCPFRPESELDQRGWTFQERLLSRRVLSITRSVLFWDCCRLSAADTRPSGLRGDYSPGFRDSDERKAKKQLLTRNLDFSEDLWPDIHLTWRRILTDYTRRKFSRVSDRVIAIEGVVQCLAAVLNEKCVLGMCEGDVVRSLMWFCDHTTVESKSCNDITAPSWSWASVTVPIHYKLWHPLEGFTNRRKELVHPCIRLLSIKASPTYLASFSDFTGMVVLRGPFAYVERNHLSREGCKLSMDNRWTRNWPDMRRYLEMGPWKIASKVPVLPIFWEGASRIHQAVYCLVLAPENSELVFRRIGVLVIAVSSRPLCVNDPDLCEDERCDPDSPHPDESFDTSQSVIAEAPLAFDGDGVNTGAKSSLANHPEFGEAFGFSWFSDNGPVRDRGIKSSISHSALARSGVPLPLDNLRSHKLETRKRKCQGTTQTIRII